MNLACFEKASLSNDLNFLKSKRGVFSTQKDWEDDHPLPGSRGKITIIVEQPVRVNLKENTICIDLIKRCCIISKECGKMLMPQKKPYCTIWSEGAAKNDHAKWELSSAKTWYPRHLYPHQPSARQELLWLRFDRGERTPELSGCAKEYSHMQEIIKRTRLFLKRDNVFKAHSTMQSFSGESNVTVDTAARQCRSLFTVKYVK